MESTVREKAAVEEKNRDLDKRVTRHVQDVVCKVQLEARESRQNSRVLLMSDAIRTLENRVFCCGVSVIQCFPNPAARADRLSVHFTRGAIAQAAQRANHR